MLGIEGYRVEDKIYEGHKTLIYKGRKNSNNLPVVFKVLKNPFPGTNAIFHLEQEYRILEDLSLPGITKPVELVKHRNLPVLIMEYIDGLPLEKAAASRPLELPLFFDLAVKIVKILGQIHESNIIHKDLNLSNILWNSNTGILKIIDFGISSRLSYESQEVLFPTYLEGTLFYISPEQTGRMNRTLDYRTDYYSLGVCFYKLATGKMPFFTRDPMELIHCHIARSPAEPVTINKALPEVVSRVILRLMAKRAEERYQSTSGLLYDLEKCYSVFREGQSTVFTLGEKDRLSGFRVPENLYGREEEITLLNACFEKIAEGEKQILFLSGPAGIGKSSVITEMNKFIIKKRIYFITGKYDQSLRNLPYSGIIQALRNLCRQLLTESEERLSSWKEKILKAVSANGRVLADLVPEIEWIIGRQPPVESLPPKEAQYRFNLVFLEFIKLFALAEHPIVLFLDDLQWADSSSFSLLYELYTAVDIHYLFCLAAYRDNEVDAQHPLSDLLEKLKTGNIKYTAIQLQALSVEQVNHMISDALSLHPEQTGELAELIFAKTGGNPFFIKSCLQGFYKQKLIRYMSMPGAPGETGWVWELEKIKQSSLMENLADLVAGKIRTLTSVSRDVLKIACCFGSRISQGTLAKLYGKTELETLEDLKEAIEESMMIKAGDSYMFSHDRIRETAYLLIGEGEAVSLHYRIGRTLLDNCNEDTLEQFLYNITEQWNRARPLLNTEETAKLLEMNLQAGRKAKATNAFVPAINFLENGIALLPENPWESRYGTACTFYRELAEAEYATYNFTRAEELFTLLLEKSGNLVDTIKTYSMIITYYSTRERFQEAIDTGVKALKLLGIIISYKQNPLSLLKDLAVLKLLLANKKREDLLNLPQMKNEKKILTMEILFKCVTSAIIYMPQLSLVLIIRMIILSLRYGTAPTTSYAFVTYGIILSSVFGDLKGGYEFGEIAKIIVEKSGNKFMKSGVFFGFAVCLLHLKQHYRDMLAELKQIFNYCIEAGDLEIYGHSLSNWAVTCFFTGINLKQAYDDTLELNKRVYNLKQPHIINYHNTVLQILLNLLTDSGHSFEIRGEYVDETRLIKEYRASGNQLGLGVLYLLKLALSYLYGEFKAGFEFIPEIQNYESSFFGLHFNQLFAFFHGLTLCAVYHDLDPDRKKKAIKAVLSILKSYRKWGSMNKYVYYHKYLLLKAEMYRIAGKKFDAVLPLYNLAAEHATKNEILFEAAIANELAGKYLLAGEWKQAARAYLTEAHYYYERWGAVSKARQLETRYPGLIIVQRMTGKSNISLSTTSTVNISSQLDLDTIIKAAHLISGEIKLEELLRKLMLFVIRMGGAEKGCFLLSRGNRWFIEAAGHVNEKQVTVMQSIPFSENNSEQVTALLPAGIVHYVIRTRETVLLNNTEEEHDFSPDDYIIRYKPKSLLCLPLIHQNKLAAVLYLENALSSGAFTHERLEVLQTLSSQIAISLENARIYSELDLLNKNLEKLVWERTKDLNEKNKKLMDSISYAKNIQNAFFPDKDKLKRYLRDLFVIWQPKEIVGGDFYWFRPLDSCSFLLAVVDCTGHGVPGAFMSIAAYSILDKMSDRTLLHNPGAILQQLNQEIKRILKQNRKATDFNESDDGLDASVCYINTGDNELCFAAARQSLFYHAPGSSRDLVTLAGDKQSIGYRSSKDDFVYNNHKFKLAGDEIFYLFSDGIIGQIGGDRAFPLGRNRFKQIIENTLQESMDKQRALILQAFEEYQGGHSQLDDITVLGFRI